ncbi:MAG: hypothetical protein PVSMB10_14020 [Pseudarthrobacter sp.]
MYTHVRTGFDARFGGTHKGMKLLIVLFCLIATISGTPARAQIGKTDIGSDQPITLESFSEGTGPVLVMLGGGTRGAAEFAPHAHALASSFHVIRPQALNIERSEKHQPLPPGYSVKMESAAMARSLDRLGTTAAFDLVGHSLGALVALDFALDHPDRVRTLILAEPPAFWVVSKEELKKGGGMQSMYELLPTFGADIEPSDEQFIRFLCLLGKCGLRAPSPTEAGRADWVSRRSAIRGLAAVSAHVDDVNRLKHFGKPVLIVTGSETVPFHRRINDILASNFPVVERVELPGDHGASASAKDEFVSRIKAFTAKYGKQPDNVKR